VSSKFQDRSLRKPTRLGISRWALQNSEDRIRGIEAGADDFLSKPPNPHELLARIRSLVRLKRSYR
jgi:DNA-binding response OmpR family regulator